jgi:raffinose/stachyose/melibiose transport system substrate-binding protein
MSRREFLSAGAALGAGAFALKGAPGLLGLGSSSRGLSPMAARSSARSSYTIQFWDAFTESNVQKWFTDTYITAWNKTHPHLPVNLVVKPIATLFQLQSTAMDAGQGPDVVSADGSTQVIPYAKAGQILPLDSYALKYKWQDLILPWAFEASTWEGKLWSLPNALETMVNYYNPAVFGAIVKTCG